MLFDNVVLDVICKQIDDPTTYFNFSVTNKKCHRIAMLHQAAKIDQFTITVKTEGIIKRFLPDRTPHGLEENNEWNDKWYYYFGQIVAVYKGGSQLGIFHCLCTEKLEPKIILEKMELVNHIFSREMKNYCKEKCKKCDTYITPFLYE